MGRSLLAALVAIVISAVTLPAQVKKPEPPRKKIPFTSSLQAIVVTTPDWGSVKGSAILMERKNSRSRWKMVGEKFPVVVGRSGLGLDPQSDLRDDSAPVKHEGDGRAPAGLFPLTFAFGTLDVGSRLPFTKLEESTECVDDVKSGFYNKIVDRYKVGNFDWNSSEEMLAVGPQYELGVFVAYNSYPVVRGNGSCIFLHIWKDADTGTSGCTAMARENVERAARWLDPGKTPYLIQFPEKLYLKTAPLNTKSIKRV